MDFDMAHQLCANLVAAGFYQTIDAAAASLFADKEIDEMVYVELISVREWERIYAPYAPVGR